MSRDGRPGDLTIEATNDGGKLPSPIMHRGSMSPSMLSVPHVNPEPVYIAPAAAANIVTGEIVSEFQVPMYDGDGATVTPASLMLVNSFLDRLLFNFLVYSASTSLVSLRPAIAAVLKPRLAKEAIAGADEELQEYLGGDDEELDAFHNGKDAPSHWDLDLVWQRTRLRCMVYTRLGDMEEEDEDMYIRQEGLDDTDSAGRVSRDFGIVSPAVAIFLTSILEFVGEHALMVAGQAAYKRAEIKARLEGQRSESIQTIVVEEADMEKVAGNPTLGRLWRSWRKVIRSPRDSGIGRGHLRTFSHTSGSRRSSAAGAAGDMPEEEAQVPSVAEVLEEPDPTGVPLPLGEHDVSEIEVPGYSAARTLHLSGDRTRPASMFHPRWQDSALVGEPESVALDADDAHPYPHPHALDSSEEGMPQPRRRRSHSLPLPLRPAPAIPPESESGSEFQTADEERQIAPDAASELAQKPVSAPTSPSYNAVLSVLAQAAARSGSAPPTHVPDGSDQDESDPAAGALQFDQNDYIIKDNERAALEPEPRTRDAVRPSAETSFLQMDDPQDTYDLNSSVRGGSHYDPGDGEISPVGRLSVRSGEVSPIGSEDEDAGRETLASKSYPDASDMGPPVSPLVERHDPLPVSVPAQQQHHGPAQGSPRSMQAWQRRNEGPASDDPAKDEKREVFVVNDIAPAPAVPRSASGSSSLSGRDLQPDGTIAAKRARTAAVPEPGAPNLAPLRELMEAAHDTSDDASSARSQADHGQLASRKASLPPVSIPKSNLQSRKSMARRQLPEIQTGAEKAAVQRISPVASRDSAIIQARRESESSNRAMPKASLSIRGKTRGASSAGDKVRDSTASRSSDSGKTLGTERPSTSMNQQEKSFEQLMDSGETIQYTLTPQNMRNIEERDPRQTSPNATTSTTSNPARGERVHNTDRKAASRRTLPTSAQSTIAEQQLQADSPPSFAIHSGPVVKRGPAAVPREAKVQKDNIKDFADFIRSTGPDNDGIQPASLPPVSTRSSQIAKQQGRIRTSKAGPRLQARDPTVRSGETSDLIDFIRSGPPADRAAGAYKGTRAAAPLRSTQDSDDLGLRARDTNSVASTQDSNYMAKSIQSSTNSRTGLLESSRANAKIVAAPEPKRPQKFEEPAAPVRKQRRVRDPYAIDTDSEDEADDDDLATPTGRAGNDESLLDFLNSTPPPDARISPPPIELSKSAIKAHQHRASAGGTAGAVRQRLLSGRSGNKDQAGPPPPEKPVAPASRREPGGVDRGGSVYAQMQRTGPAAGGIQAGSAGRAPAAPKSAGMGRARAAGGEVDNMRDLADFLKNAPPPPPSVPSFDAKGERKEEGGFAKIFGRRKKTGLA